MPNEKMEVFAQTPSPSKSTGPHSGPRSTLKFPPSDRSDSLSSQTSLSEEEEDYDTLPLDRSAVIEGSKGGGAEHDAGSKMDTMHAMATSEDGRRGSLELITSLEAKQPDGGSQPSRRRRSLHVVLETTDKKGRYVLTAGDPEIREILRSTIEQESAQTDAKKRTRFGDMVFTRRFTRFDRQNESESPFYGFFTLFWVCIGFLLIRVAAHNWHDYGSVLGRAEILHIMTDRDLVVLGVTDGVMCLGTMAGLLLQRLIVADYLSWTRSGWIIQNLWQTFYLGAVIWWTYYREWPWTHTIFTVLHGLVFLMKQHSYAFYNGYLSQVYRRKQIIERKLQQLDAMSPCASPASVRTGILTTASVGPDTEDPHGHSNDASVSPADEGDTTRRRHKPSNLSTASADLQKEHSEIASVASAIEAGTPLDPGQIATFKLVLQKELSRLSDELDGKCTSTSNAYPSNLTVANWADWTCLPTLVYELEYPRQERINWPYVAEKTAACFGSIWVMIVVSQAYIYPLVQRTVDAKAAGIPLAQRIRDYPVVCMDIAFPMLLEQLLTWYVIWECVLNVLAELTRFADRGFYGDWWNSVSWDQYARDWNRPVHNFLLRHVYHSSISVFHLNKTSATLVTFLLSALVHELVMWCLFKKVRGYLFMMQIMQVPLVSMSRTKLLRGRKMVGNLIFWIGLFLGPSVITSLYLIV